jgi:hypothetical protein
MAKLNHVDQHPEIALLDAKLRTLQQRKTAVETRLREAAKHRQENEDESAVDKLITDPGSYSSCHR